MLAANASLPALPVTYPIYLGFYVLPGDSPLPKGVVRVDFFYSTSLDDLSWNNTFTYLASGTSETGFYAVHPQLDINIYYGYYSQYIYSDGSKGPLSGVTDAGQAQLLNTSSLNINKLADSAYTTGLVTSGIFEGVIFRTGHISPLVQMDPSGIWATDSQGNYTFQLNAATGAAAFSGQIDLHEGSAPLVSTMPSSISWGGGNIIPNNDVLPPAGTGLSFASVGAGNSWTWNGSTLSVSENSAQISSTLYLTGFNANIPTAATITGITVAISKYEPGIHSGTVTIHDYSVKLLKGGIPQGTDKAIVGLWPTQSSPAAVYGTGTADMWGLSLSPSDINSPSFGVAIAVQGTGGIGARTANIVSTYITVYYNTTILGTNSSWIQGVYQGGHHGLYVGASDGAASTPVRTVLDDTGASSFLQLLSSGQDAAAFNSTGPVSGQQFTVAHGLGRTPTLVLSNAYGWPGYMFPYQSPDATNIYLESSVVLTNQFFMWLAIG